MVMKVALAFLSYSRTAALFTRENAFFNLFAVAVAVASMSMFASVSLNRLASAVCGVFAGMWVLCVCVFACLRVSVCEFFGI